VHVAVFYYEAAVRDTTKVCLVKRQSGEGGVGIFTPKTWWSRKPTEHLYFEVELILPRGSSLSPSYINSLSTDVNNFSHDVDSLKDIVNFGSISLRASNGKINAKSLDAKDITLTTSNGAVGVDYLVAPRASIRSSNAGISGNYQVSDSLAFTTSNGAIQATIGINGSESSKSLTMRTSNDVIDTTINLATSSGKAGKFLVKADTSNGRVTTRVGSLPLDSVLTFEGRTSNSQASVALPPTYEGAFKLYTSNSVPNVYEVNGNERDPGCKKGSDCKGRTRRLETHLITKGQATGNVYWDRKNLERGSVTLRTSNGAVAIYI